jgi:methionine synthase / methylenetetrahydrofolate reductase(NADPH)
LDYGANIVGANCSVGPQPMLDVIERMGGDILLAAQPNAGLPRVVGGRYVYLTSPKYFAEYALKFVAAGVSIVGGCCGTTPDHIRAVAEAVRGRKKIPSQAFLIRDVEEETQPETAESKHVCSNFSEDLGKRFLVSVEIDPPRSINPEPCIRSAQMLKAGGVDLINVADSPLARSRLSALAMSHLIRRDAGIDVLLHMSCRDRNALALQSELLGAHALGILNILAITGDPPAVGDYPFAKAVFELDSIGLVKMISQLNMGRDLTGREMEEPTEFLLGVGVNPTATNLELEYDRFHRKMDAGAKFAFTQPLYCAATLEKFLSDVSGFCRIPVFVGILPLRSAKHAEFIHNEIPDMFVPDTIRDRMQKSGNEGARVGVEIAQGFLSESRGLVQGVYLMPPFNKFEIALEVLRAL